MNNNLLPLGTVIELENGEKLIIIDYEFNNNTYFCAGYPTYFITDLIPFSKVKEFKNKYKFYNIDKYLPINKDYKVIYMGYKNSEFEKFKSIMLENN